MFLFVVKTVYERFIEVVDDVWVIFRGKKDDSTNKWAYFVFDGHKSKLKFRFWE